MHEAKPFDTHGGSRDPVATVEHPGQFAPSPDDVTTQFDEALAELERFRGREPRLSGYAHKSHKSVFWASFGALAASACDAVREINPDCSWSANNPAPEISTVHVVASGPGSGKTTAAKAFMAALVRETEGRPFPVGCALLVQYVKTADKAYRELNELLPGKVAVWTREHDADSLKVVRQPRFTVAELEEYPVVIVTHEFFKGVRGERARYYNRNGLRLPRAVTFIDERAAEVETYSVQHSDIVSVGEFIRREFAAPLELRDSLRLLEHFTSTKRYADGGLETPRHDPDAWKKIAERLEWFTSDEARQYLRDLRINARRTPPHLEDVFGFAECVAENRAFIVRRNGGKQGTDFVGYEPALPSMTGMVLLDASADVDGVSELCSWRKHVDVPPACYDRLEIVQVPSVAKGTLGRWLQDAHNRKAYVAHILDTVRRHVEPGQKALLVCKKEVAEAKEIPHWSEHVSQFANKGPEDESDANAFPWEFEGRRLGLTWWGGYGIGANDWRDAEVVLLFDDYHLPKHILIAITQGLMRLEATKGPLTTMTAINSHCDEVDTIQTGHLLRWMKQMALRGRSRDFDESGICGPQKLVVTGDVIEHVGRVFPGASFSRERVNGQKQTRLEHLIDILSDQSLSSPLTTGQVGGLMGVSWGKMSKDLTRHKKFEPLLKAIGWKYVSRRGAGGSYFEKL